MGRTPDFAPPDFAPPDFAPSGPDSAAPAQGVVRPLAGAYERRGLLGRGGAGIVHLAHQAALGRDVAVKSVNPDSPTPGARRSILLEARAAAALEHPNVVPIYDLGLGLDGAPHVVMRRIQGRDWTVYLTHPELIFEDFGARDVLGWHLRVLTRVCSAIHAAHERGILHRDLKPDNVMIGRYGEVYVLDWGLATGFSEEAPAELPPAREDLRIVGTPRYMAPEMARGDGPALSPRTDVYLLAGLLYCVLAGRGPHDGDSIRDVLKRIPEFKPALPESTPARLVALVQAGMAAEPQSRPESAKALRLAVLGFLEERSADALVQEATEQLARLQTELGQETAERQALYRHFGAARFGFQQALRAYPESIPARDGLRGALVAMARYELDQGDDRAADVHLAELDTPPDALVARKTALLAARQAVAARHAAEQLDQDPTIGRRTRIFVFSGVMIIWTIIPFVTWLTAREVTHFGSTVLHGVMFGVVGGLVVWARDSLSRTALNRRIAAFLVVIQGMLLVGDVGGWVLEVPAPTVATFHLLMFATVCGIAVEVVGRPAWVLAVAYAATFLACSLRPDLLLPLSAASNLLVAVVAYIWWAPANRRELFRRPSEGP